jgi:hypothetical protein
MARRSQVPDSQVVIDDEVSLFDTFDQLVGEVGEGGAVLLAARRLLAFGADPRIVYRVAAGWVDAVRTGWTGDPPSEEDVWGATPQELLEAFLAARTD